MECTATPKKILYGIQGEGRGHASRSLNLIHYLQRQGHQILVLSGGDALPLLNNSSLSIIKAPLFRLHFTEDNKLSIWQTAIKNTSLFLGLMFGRGKRYRYVLDQIKKFKPDLSISDFEPYSARLPARLGIPLLAIDHQHFLLETKLPSFRGVKKQLKLIIYRIFIGFLSGKPDKVLISSFYHFPAVKNSRAVFVGPLISRLLYNKKISTQNLITIYLKEPHYLYHLLPVLKQIEHLNFEVYSNWSQLDISSLNYQHIRLCRIDQDKFLSSLASSKALITTAGNQVIGEAIFLGKPVLAFPKLGDIEQEMNGFALKLSGFGEMVDVKKFTNTELTRFLNQMPVYKKNIRDQIRLRKDYDGTFASLKIMDQFINEYGKGKQTVFEFQFERIKLNFKTLLARISHYIFEGSGIT